MITAIGSGDASGGGGGSAGGNVDLNRHASQILQDGILNRLVGVASGGILKKLE
ncbi:hypothetical protein [Halorubrum tropicale]|uniref:hypothetical protein n=1 Tax=Halorubrum tropicale TaxID=1765655 RepID=UPI000A49FDAB|nr:hypothetical protein [Halorubrum tropicale]